MQCTKHKQEWRMSQRVNKARRIRRFGGLKWPVILPVWAVVGVVLSREVCSAQGASGPSAKAATARRMPGSNAQRSCPVARDAVILQVHVCVAFDFIRMALSLAYYCDQGTLRRLSLDVRLRTQLHNTRCVLLTDSPLAAFEELL